MEMRFVRGGDGDFDYRAIDEDEGYDDRTAEELEAEEVYFGEQTPEFVSREGVARSRSKEIELEGETGVQDF